MISMFYYEFFVLYHTLFDFVHSSDLDYVPVFVFHDLWNLDRIFTPV